MPPAARHGKDPALYRRLICKGTEDTVAEFRRKRADDPFTAADIAAQEQMRKRWLVDQLFSDPFAAKIVPFEIWSFQNVAPVSKF
ncbi:MAG: hypothetical protein V2J12_04615 [Gammaproteobacteria bacterium]|nr:hypothetical protein [Gammaproteobacteria bacterium]